jgi:hypothetical protein
MLVLLYFPILFADHTAMWKHESGGIREECLTRKIASKEMVEVVHDMVKDLHLMTDRLE